ncbi:hypothetical protein L249_3862 [Ophiocordyceps polyrhachis-furcata BCC 54312]|uniref:Uncharacterized protein n=1 Tax=Ophiocordyceps polyrhachis-furcata BCC 54312 TaxID=1330021 RepID=A0A367L4Z5_9HYPO|nr:hypothetical protein L249_3862 [Ophiocordyceps polyrhachis-furcata BCC 54312]
MKAVGPAYSFNINSTHLAAQMNGRVSQTSTTAIQAVDHVNGDLLKYEVRTDDCGNSLAKCKYGNRACAVKLSMSWHKSLRARWGSNHLEPIPSISRCTCEAGHCDDLNCAMRRVCAKAGIAVGKHARQAESVLARAIAAALTHLSHTSLNWLLADAVLPPEFLTAAIGNVWPLAERMASLYALLRRSLIRIDGIRAGLDNDIMVALLTHDSTLMMVLSNLVSLYLFDQYKVMSFGEQMSPELKLAVEAARAGYDGPVQLKRGNEHICMRAAAPGFAVPRHLQWLLSSISSGGTVAATVLWPCEGSDTIEAGGDDISFYLETRLTAWPAVKMTAKDVQEVVGRIGDNGAERGLGALMALDYTILHHAQEVHQSFLDPLQGSINIGRYRRVEDLPFSAARVLFFELAEHGLYQYMVDDLRASDTKIPYDGVLMSDLLHRVQDWGIEVGSGESLQTMLGLLRASYDAVAGLCICGHVERVWVLVVTWVDHVLATQPLARTTGVAVMSALWIYTTGRHPAFVWERLGREHKCCARLRCLISRRLPNSGGVMADMRDLARIYGQWDEAKMTTPLMARIGDEPEGPVGCDECRLPDRLAAWLRVPGMVAEEGATAMQTLTATYIVHLATCQATARRKRRALLVRMFCKYMCSPGMFYVSLGRMSERGIYESARLDGDFFLGDYFQLQLSVLFLSFTDVYLLVLEDVREEFASKAKQQSALPPPLSFFLTFDRHGGTHQGFQDEAAGIENHTSLAAFRQAAMGPRGPEPGGSNAKRARCRLADGTKPLNSWLRIPGWNNKTGVAFQRRHLQQITPSDDKQRPTAIIITIRPADNTKSDTRIL